MSTGEFIIQIVIVVLVFLGVVTAAAWQWIKPWAGRVNRRIKKWRTRRK